MRNLDLLPVPKETKDLIRLSADKARAFFGIHVDIFEFGEGIVRIRVTQVDARNNFILSQRELVQRAGQMFGPLAQKFRLHYVPLTYQPTFEHVTAPWIKAQMKEFGLNPRDVAKQMELEYNDFRLFLKREDPLPNLQKVAFYYYFSTYQINRDVRGYLSQSVREPYDS